LNLRLASDFTLEYNALFTGTFATLLTSLLFLLLFLSSRMVHDKN
jgi:hypothetical protein